MTLNGSEQEQRITRWDVYNPICWRGTTKHTTSKKQSDRQSTSNWSASMENTCFFLYFSHRSRDGSQPIAHCHSQTRAYTPIFTTIAMLLPRTFIHRFNLRTLCWLPFWLIAKYRLTFVLDLPIQYVEYAIFNHHISEWKWRQSTLIVFCSWPTIPMPYAVLRNSQRDQSYFHCFTVYLKASRQTIPRKTEKERKKKNEVTPTMQKKMIKRKYKKI